MLATSEPTSPDFHSEEHAGPPFSLSTEAPRATRHLVIRATAAKPEDTSVWGELSVRISARWKPTDPTLPQRPWFRASLQGASSPDPIVVLGGPDDTTVIELRAGLSKECPLDAACEWHKAVDFEVQDNVSPGTVDVEWTAVASAHVEGTSDLPKGFTLEVSSP
ncbi:hypothetical protein [Pyxidicoccus trucidator]|uniref:hypothetical protein n=1 Tax=Pyxidicoccus trucidator TaxID=2709662 RepID=UPI0019678D6B|nr:hypothetical protein [Pyxidicoccus trucidator]